jgi:hypothetical protein
VRGEPAKPFVVSSSNNDDIGAVLLRGLGHAARDVSGFDADVGFYLKGVAKLSDLFASLGG